MGVPRDPSFGNIPEADQAGKAQESIGAIDEKARGLVTIATGGADETYVVQTDNPYLVLVSSDQAWKYGEAVFDISDPAFPVLNEYKATVADDFLVPVGIPWKIRSPGLGNDVNIQAATTGTKIFIIETD